MRRIASSRRRNICILLAAIFVTIKTVLVLPGHRRKAPQRGA
jgi:hypothetical protein